MLDTDTKRRIDTARNILVGKVPDPKSQVEQITIALIYKFMDDMDADAEEMGGKRKFFAGKYARYGWSKLMQPGLGGHEMLNLYAEGIQKMPENPGIPPLFREIFKNAFLPYRDPETLKAFLKVIDEFSYDHSERLGDAFEYLLSVLGSQGDAGQFRTPRHIIDFIVEIIDPKKDETVLDPACGTAGFLISSYKHILKANSDAQGHNKLTPSQRGQLANNITGYDISPDMVGLSLVNLYLHGFPDPHITEYDTLTSLERWNEHADVILANPPFMSPKGGIKPHNRFGVQSKRSEVLFVDYIAEHLTPNGRAGVIVPEGIHFVAQSSYEKLRRMLITDNFLVADVTLPHGVFKPYASVKTHVLVLDRVLARRASDVLFIEIENDGFAQTDTREPIEGSQLADALAIVHDFKESITRGKGWKNRYGVRAYTVTKSRLLEGRKAHILGRWHDLPNRVTHRAGVELKRIGCLCEIKNGLSPNMATPPGGYVLVVPAEARKTADHWDFEGPGVCVPLVSSAGHGKADIKRIHYQEGKFALANTMCALFVKDPTELRPRFLHLFLEAAKEELMVPLMCGATNVTMDSEQLADLLVPIPDPDIQDEIIETHLIRSKAAEVLDASDMLCQNSKDKRVAQFALRVADDARELIRAVEGKRDIATVMA